MVRHALRRGGWALAAVLCLTLAVLAGCDDSTGRKAAREAEAAQQAALEQQRKVSMALGSASLTETSREREVTASLAQAEKLLAGLLARQPSYWPARAQLGEVILLRADFLARMRVVAQLTAIRQDASSAVQSLGFLKAHELAAKRWQITRSSYADTRDALAGERAKLQDELKKLQDKIVESKRLYGERAKEASRLAAAATTQQEAADALVAKAEKMPVSNEQLAALAEAYGFQKEAARLSGEAAVAEAEAQAYYDAKAREAAAADLNAPTTAPDEPGKPSRRTLALLAIPDDASRAELAIEAVRARLAAIDKEEADCQRSVAVADARLGESTTTAPDDLKRMVADQQLATRVSLERVAGAAATLDEIVASADAEYDRAIKELKTAVAAARQANDFRELGIRLHLADACAGKGYMHILLADAAGVLDQAREIAADAKMAGVRISDPSKTVADLKFGSHTTKDSKHESERDAGVELLRQAAWTLDDGKAAAQAAEASSGDANIRDGRLWTFDLTRTRARFEAMAGQPIGLRTSSVSGGPVGGGPGPLPGPAPEPGPTPPTP